MLNNCVSIQSGYYKGKEEELRFLLSSIGDSIEFNNNVWICDKLKRSASEELKDITLYFTNIPQDYLEITRYFCLSRLQDGKSMNTVDSNLQSLAIFYKFLIQKCDSVALIHINKNTISVFQNYLKNLDLTESSKYTTWIGISQFFKRMKGWEGIPSRNPVYTNPFKNEKKHDDKYIPEFVVTQYDKAFKLDEIPLYQRTIYWVARSIPSRISEVLGMKLDCLKPFNGDWVLFMPTWKQNGGYLVPQIRTIHLKYESHGKLLIDLIRQQQKISQELQDNLEPEERGLLFTYKVAKIILKNFRESGVIEYCETKATKVSNISNVQNFFEKISQIFNIVDEQGNQYNITSHQLRHNGITDRLYAGFQPIEARYMTDHQGDAMIIGAYNHINLNTELIKEKQSLVHNKKDDVSDEPKVFFKGRILNMNEQLEKRLLRNIRAQRTKGGLCSDITNCKSKMFECLSCNDFIPNVDDLDYFENQVIEWQRKVEAFKDHPYILENAKYNLMLNQNIVDKIRRVIEPEVE